MAERSLSDTSEDEEMGVYIENYLKDNKDVAKQINEIAKRKKKIGQELLENGCLMKIFRMWEPQRIKKEAFIKKMKQKLT